MKLPALDPNDRKTYIGSSDAVEILKGNFGKLFAQKMGTAPESPTTFPMALGKHVEPFHLDWSLRELVDESSVPWEFSKETKEHQHFASFEPTGFKNNPRLGSHPDAVIRQKGDSGTLYPFEAKLTARFSSVEEAAQFYMPQLQHHMLCWGAPQLLFSVIIGTKEPQRAWIGTSTAWAHNYIEKCRLFWAILRSGKAPAPFIESVGSPIVRAEIADTVPINDLTRRNLSTNNRAITLVSKYVRTKKIVAEHEKIKSELKDLMKPTEGELYCDGFKMKKDKRGVIRFHVSDEEKFLEEVPSKA